MDTRISGTTRLLGLIGDPVRHSASPLMHNFCFNYYGMDCVFLAFSSTLEQTAETLQAARRLNMRGLSVTMPCKREAARLVDRLSPAAELVGAVNTIVNDGGVLTGYITDGLGLVLDLRDHGQEVAGRDLVLLGAGGAAMAILAQCALEGARSVTVLNRSREGLDRAAALGERIAEKGLACRVTCVPLAGGAALRQAVQGAQVLINATSAGMAPAQAGLSPVEDPAALHRDLTVYDVIYNPACTRLMEQARQQGCRLVLGGKGMLLWQASEAFRLFTGKPMPVEALKAYLAQQ